MQTVRSIAPQHVPSLLTLSELCIAQRVWPEAVSALESVVAISRDTAAKLTALFALAAIYERVLARPADVDRVLRATLAIESHNARALRALLKRTAVAPAKADPAAERARQTEMAELLERLTEVENDPDQRAAFLVELSECRLKMGEKAAAERTLVEAVAAAPGNARAVTRRGARFVRVGQADAGGYARALGVVIVALGEENGHVAAWWFRRTRAARGRDARPAGRRPGAPAARREARPGAARDTLRASLAARRGGGANEEAARVLVEMLRPPAHPLPVLTLDKPAAALGRCSS